MKKALNVEKGSGTASQETVGTLSREKVKEIAKLKLKDLNRHALIIGPSGVGKTNVTRVLADGLMDHIPIMIFDRTGDHIKAYKDKKEGKSGS